MLALCAPYAQSAAKTGATMASSQPTYWMVVLPWLQLPEEVRIRDVCFVPVDACNPGRAVCALAPISDDCSQVLRRFRDGGQPIQKCTLLVPDRYDPTTVPSEDRISEFGRLATLLMLSAFAASEYGLE